MNKIEQDQARFRAIVKGAIKRDLGRFIKHGEMIGRKGKNLVSIPLPQIDPPDFRHGINPAEAGVGQGKGEPGTPLAPGDPQDGGREAGDQPGEHILEVEITLDELAQILGEELELPRIEPRGKKNIESTKAKYTGISRTGPESLRHFKRTYKQALRRQLITGEYDPSDPRIIPVRPDQQYRSWKVVPKPEANALTIYMMDVSASVSDEQKEMVRTEAFWIDAWLQSQYKGVQCCYIVHDVDAREVDQQTFYRTRESGGTKISSAFELALGLIRERFSPDDWNIYVFQFSDGENLPDDDSLCCRLLIEQLLPVVNLFCYGQVKGAGRGSFIYALQEMAAKVECDNLTTSVVRSKDEILESIKAFLGKGK